MSGQTRLLASNRSPRKQPEKTGLFMVDSAGKRRRSSNCHHSGGGGSENGKVRLTKRCGHVRRTLRSGPSWRQPALMSHDSQARYSEYGLIASADFVERSLLFLCASRRLAVHVKIWHCSRRTAHACCTVNISRNIAVRTQDVRR